MAKPQQKQQKVEEKSQKAGQIPDFDALFADFCAKSALFWWKSWFSSLQWQLACGRCDRPKSECECGDMQGAVHG